MSTINPVMTPINYSDENASIISWGPVTNADSCAAVEMPGFNFKSFQVSGTFGSATVLASGSNDGTNYAGLHDLQGNAVSFTSAGLKSVEEVVRYLKPTFSGGDGTQSLTVTVVMVRRGL